MLNPNTTVNLFFACDMRYVPYLAVTLNSIKRNRDITRNYRITVLHTEISTEYQNRIIAAFHTKGFAIDFFDISKKMASIENKLHTRDYYSKTTYYRLFIPSLFPDIDKALYLDVDIAVIGDISELFDFELSDKLVGAVTDGFVSHADVLKNYVLKRVGCERREDYFNAGILLMNLKKMRECSFEKLFIDLIEKVKFSVAQDQDYLNVICRGQRLAIGYEWNCMPGYELYYGTPKLVHYNIDNKPWHKDGVNFADIFWNYAKDSGFYEEIKIEKNSFGEVEIQKSKDETVALCDVAVKEAEDEDENARIAAVVKEILTPITKTNQ